ncbi:MAG: DsbA family protein [Gammaproteobacteria bacterium]|nr:DsbA family protein [Gammaproteobacteria bacterium]
MSEQTARARILVWSDYVCPYCYLLERDLDRLREQHAGELIIDYRAFELRPAPNPTLEPRGEYLLTAWSRSVYPMAERYGMPIKLPSVQPHSLLAFQMTEYARGHGRTLDTHMALFRAFFVDDRNIGELAVLLEIANELGLDAEELQQHLEAGTYKAEVDRQRAEGLARQISGVPSLFVEPVEAGAFAASGAIGADIVAVERFLRAHL